LGRTVPGSYSWADLSLAEELARRAALALENARLYRQTEAELLARRQAEERLTALLQEEEKLLKEKELLLKEVYHRVKNNLQGVSNLIYLQASYIKDEQVRAMLQQTQDRVQSMALIHEKLYQSQDLARVDFAEYVNSLARHLIYSYQADPNLITLKTRIDNIILDADALIPIGIIVNELVSNALKHAFPNGRGGEIVIELLREADNRFLLSVGDNGVGLPEQFDLANTASLGLQLVQTLAGSIRGAVEIDRSSGTRVTIRFERLAG
jgi:two-component sensor histidine kinase